MEEGSHNNKGVVNEGFSVDFSSEEEEDISGIDKTDPLSRKCYQSSGGDSGSYHHVQVEPPTSSNLFQLSAPRSSLTNEVSQPKPRLSTQLDTDKGQTFSSAESFNQKEDAQANNMLPEARKSVLSSEHNPPPHANSVHSSSETKKSSLDDSCNEKDVYIIPKQYLRDVRLSLDPSKPNSVGQPFQNGTKGNYGGSSHLSNQEVDSDSDCDTCKKKVMSHYKLVCKYVLERPLFCFAIWAVLYIYWGNDALPGGSLFALTVLEISALCLGYTAEVIQLPSFMGFIVAGIILRNVPYIDVAKDLEGTEISLALRGMSVVILLIRGALGVNLVNITKFLTVIAPLVIGSCVLEAVAGTIAVYYILKFPLEWAALMGCIMSAMSNMAVLPYLGSTEKFLSLKADPCTLSPNYQKVITIVRTACGLDAILAICMAEVALGFIFAEGKIGTGIVKGAVEVMMGGAFGLLWGFLAALLLDETSSNEKRTTVIFAGGVMSLIGLGKIGYPRGGPLATFVGTLIPSTVWKKKQIGGPNNEQLAASFTILWFLFQPLLFGIIGARTDFGRVDWAVVTKGLGCLAISLAIRSITSFSVTYLGNLSIKERIFICCCWQVKGTVQAALGPAALDTALGLMNLSSPDKYADLGYTVMYLSVFILMVASFCGCYFLRFIGPRFLSSHK